MKRSSRVWPTKKDMNCMSCCWATGGAVSSWHRPRLNCRLLIQTAKMYRIACGASRMKGFHCRFDLCISLFFCICFPLCCFFTCAFVCLSVYLLKSINFKMSRQLICLSVYLSVTLSVCQLFIILSKYSSVKAYKLKCQDTCLCFSSVVKSIWIFLNINLFEF